MGYSIRVLESGNIIIKEKNNLQIGLRVISHAHSAVLRYLQNVSDIPGWITDGNNHEPWKGEKWLRYNKSIYLCGAYQLGRGIQHCVRKEEAVCVTLLIKTLLYLNQNDILPKYFLWDCVEYCNRGKMFFFPPDVLRYRLKYDKNSFEHTVCTRYEGEIGIVFSLSLFLYHYYTGRYPYSFFNDQTFHKMHEDDVEVLTVQLSPAHRDLIYQGLCKKVTLNDFSLFLSKHSYRTLDSQKGEVLQNQVRRQVERCIPKVETVRTRKRRTWILVLCIVTALVGVGIFSGLQKTHPIQESNARQVVQQYYASISTLDYDYIKKHLADRSKTFLLWELAYLSVSRKIRALYQPEFRIISAKEWVKGGKQNIEKSEFVYGIIHLSLRNITNVRFLARYEFWHTKTEGKPQGREVVEELFLERLRGRWKIKKIIEIRVEDIDRM